MAAKTTTNQATRFSRQREQFLSRLDQLLTEARAIEDALGMRSRILAEAPPEEDDFEEPRGKISRRVWEYILKHPGLTSTQLCKALRMKPVQMATAINTLVRKNGQVMVEGRKGAFRHYARTRRDTVQ